MSCANYHRPGTNYWVLVWVGAVGGLVVLGLSLDASGAFPKVQAGIQWSRGRKRTVRMNTE